MPQNLVILKEFKPEQEKYIRNLKRLRIELYHSVALRQEVNSAHFKKLLK